MTIPPSRYAAQTVRETLSALTLSNERQGYVTRHYRRYARLLDYVDAEWTRRNDAPIKILDVGPDLQTYLLDRYFPNASVDTLGYDDPTVRKELSGWHTHLDLNRCPDKRQWPKWPKSYDVVVMAEVIEHLSVPPVWPMMMLFTALSPGGALIVQTPNFAALIKRLQVMRGTNPFPIPTGLNPSPDHCREYTRSELFAMGTEAGFNVEGIEGANYFSGDRFTHRLAAGIGSMLPQTFRNGLTALMRRPDEYSPIPAVKADATAAAPAKFRLSEA